MSQFKREIPELFKELSDDLDEVLDSLIDIPEFTDKRLPDSIRAFRGWLEYRADGLEDFKEDLQKPAMKLYTHGLMDEMGKYLKRTDEAIEGFAKDGEPNLQLYRSTCVFVQLITLPYTGVNAIKNAQDRSQVQLQNMSTVYLSDDDE
ncbi:hypothetical protein FRC00_013865 [Tulasnella sp. 408]|nr:hypothetical protein FRC00_013865 [Tulasnella sp. 408]